MLDLDAVEAIANGKAALWPHWKSDAREMVETIRRLRAENAELRGLCGEANDLIEWDYGGTGDFPRNSIKSRLEAASKGEA